MVTAGTSLQILLVAACSQISSTLFYTNSRENDYPRIGKRLDVYQVLKGKSSYPKYLDIAKQEMSRTNKFNTGIPVHDWDVNEKLPTLLDGSEKDKIYGIPLPLLVNVAQKLGVIHGEENSLYFHIFSGIDLIWFCRSATLIKS